MHPPTVPSTGDVLCPFSDSDSDSSVKAASSCSAYVNADDGERKLWFGSVCFGKDQRANTVVKRIKALSHGGMLQIFVLGSPFQIWALFNASSARRVSLKDAIPNDNNQC